MIRRKFIHHPLAATELLTSAAIGLFGIFLLSPGDTFDRDWYQPMKSIAPENAWGAFLTAIAVACYVNVLWFERRFVWLNFATSALVLAFWSYVCARFVVTFPPAAASAPFLVYWALSAWLFGHSFDKGLGGCDGCPLIKEKTSIGAE